MEVNNRKTSGAVSVYRGWYVRVDLFGPGKLPSRTVGPISLDFEMVSW